MNWQIGDMAIVVGGDELAVIGREITIVGIKSIFGVAYHEVDIPAGPNKSSGPIVGGLQYRSGSLKPIPDDDSKQVTTWDECEFQPKELVTA